MVHDRLHHSAREREARLLISQIEREEAEQNMIRDSKVPMSSVSATDLVETVPV